MRDGFSPISSLSLPLSSSIPDPMCLPLPLLISSVLSLPTPLLTAPRPPRLSPSHLSTTLQCPPAPGRTSRPAPTDSPFLAPSPPPPLPPVWYCHPPALRGWGPGFRGRRSARSLVLRHLAEASASRPARPGRWGTPTRLRYLAPHATRPLPAGDSLRGPTTPAAARRRRPAPAGARSHCPGPGLRGAHAHWSGRHAVTGGLRSPWLPLTAAALHCLRASLPGGRGEYGADRGLGEGGDRTGPGIGDTLRGWWDRETGPGDQAAFWGQGRGETKEKPGNGARRGGSGLVVSWSQRSRPGRGNSLKVQRRFERRKQPSFSARRGKLVGSRRVRVTSSPHNLPSTALCRRDAGGNGSNLHASPAAPRPRAGPAGAEAPAP